MNTIQDSDTKIKVLEMHIAQLEHDLTSALNEIEDIKRYLLKMVAHQTAMAEKFKLWPYVVVDKAGGESK